MNVHVAILLLTAAFSIRAAELAKRPPHMTGDQLIAELRGKSSAPRPSDRPYALGYLAGVADATQGRVWCLPSNVAPEAADKQVLDELAKRPRGSMSDPASTALLEQYQIKFPMKAATCPLSPRITGDQFVLWAVGNHQKPSAEKANPSPQVQEHERFSDGYTGGVIDATQGIDWCAPARIKPDELDAVGYWALVKKPKGSLPGNAASLLHQEFIAKYPCRSKP